jgi:hypothetical protein
MDEGTGIITVEKYAFFMAIVGGYEYCMNSV